MNLDSNIDHLFKVEANNAIELEAILNGDDRRMMFKAQMTKNALRAHVFTALEKRGLIWESTIPVVDGLLAICKHSKAPRVVHIQSGDKKFSFSVEEKMCELKVHDSVLEITKVHIDMITGA